VNLSTADWTKAVLPSIEFSCAEKQGGHTR
jgi:hypothetical protein